MSDVVDVAIVGAGPYGLSLAAHLRAAGVRYRQFGLPMHLWQSSMPKGMFLKSQGFASDLSAPKGTHTLEEFCKVTSRPYASYGLPVPLDAFVAYGQWFQAKLKLDVDEVLVTGIVRSVGGFDLTLDNGESVTARTVVVAVGVEHFAYVPEPLASLPAELCTHSSAHDDLGTFKDQEVAVVGAGQSALESAAILHESGAKVTLVAREGKLAWNGEPLALDRPLLQRLNEPESGLGSGWNTWFYSNHPQVYRHLPKNQRVYRARTALGPAGACWLRPRIDGQFTVLTGQLVKSADAEDGKVRLGLVAADGTVTDLVADHVLAGTGYRTDLSRLKFLADDIRSDLKSLAGSAVVSRSYESSVPGLYFIGPAVAPTFGPVMRFVYGARYPAAAVSARLAGTRPSTQVPVAPDH